MRRDDLAYEAEASRSYLSQLEKGAFYASLKILEKLPKALGVEPYELIAPPPKRRQQRGRSFQLRPEIKIGEHLADGRAASVAPAL